MKKTTMMMLTVAALVAAACSNDDEEQQQTLQPGGGWSEYVTVTAGAPGSAEQTSAKADGPLRVKVNPANPQKSLWETGDQLTIWTGSCTAENMSEHGFTLISGADTETGKFGGRLVSTSAPTSSTLLYAVIDNGSDAIDASSGTSVTADLHEQVGATAETAMDYELYYATSTNATRNFTFTHQMALVKWTIKVNGVSDGDQCDIVLSGAGLKNAATLDPATGTLTVAAEDGTITLKNVTLTSAAGTDVYVVLPPCTCPDGIKAKLTMTSGSKGGTVGVGTLGFGSISVAANNYYTAGVNEFTPDYEYVDLGLSVEWATCNVGATAPQDYGLFFAWGETTGYTSSTEGKTKYTDDYDCTCYSGYTDRSFNWASYKFGTYSNLTKYNSTDKKTSLDSDDDAATANRGGAWKMPTKEEWQELAENCYWVWTTDYNGTSVAGYIVYKAKADDDKGEMKYSDSDDAPVGVYSLSDAHIFLPAAGYREDMILKSQGTGGGYWSSELDVVEEDGPVNAWGLGFDDGSVDWGDGIYGTRCNGRSVRPVLAQ